MNMRTVIRSGWYVALTSALALATLPCAEAHPLDGAATAFRSYLTERTSESLAAAKVLRDCMAKHDLACAQKAWIKARGGWESVETVSDQFFPELDKAIDAWPDAKAGFHAIEAGLFGAHKTDNLAEADALVAHLGDFAQALGTTKLTAQGLLNGTTRLAYEIGESKADGGESQYSGNSLVEVGYNIAGIRAAYKGIFAPAVKAGNAALDAAVLNDLDRLQGLVKNTDLKSLDQSELRKRSEQLVMHLQAVAPAIGLEKPGLDN
jgi:iron uptake system EfeUOB component EfeO/EfeM